MVGFRKKATPVLCRSNPGTYIDGTVAFSKAGRSWTEAFDIIALAASALEGRGDKIKKEKKWLVHTASDFVLIPRLVTFEPLDQGGVRTTTTIQVNHPVLVPDGLFEYQHSTGDNMAESICKGIEQWAGVDFVPLLEALQPNPESCTTMKMSFTSEGKPTRMRRAVLGPVLHYMAKPPVKDVKEIDGAKEGSHISDADAHPFCPCCLLTNSFEAFKPLFEGNGFYGLRLFAARGGDGTAQADCRTNGDDFEQGARALQEYVKTWPQAGYEFRKQYVVFQSIENDSCDPNNKAAP